MEKKYSMKAGWRGRYKWVKVQKRGDKKVVIS
jgi:hypothetical protein